MRNFLVGLALLAGAAATPAFDASAQDFDVEIGRGGVRVERDCNPRYEECYRSERYRDHYDERPRCTEGRALRKAERMGVHRARITEVGRRTIEVRGRDRYGERIYIVFGRHPSCPVLS